MTRQQYWRWGRNGDSPDWECKTTDEQALTDWTNARLDELDALEDPTGRAIRLRDVAALKTLYPQIAQFIYLKRGRGRPPDLRRAAARRDVIRMKKIWKENYGRKHRWRWPLPETIAAERNRVAQASVARAGR